MVYNGQYRVFEVFKMRCAIACVFKRISLFLLYVVVIAMHLQAEAKFEQIEIFKDINETPFNLIKEQHFTPIENPHFNFGFDANTIVWLRLKIQNTHPHSLEAILTIDNPLLENITLYTPEGTATQRDLLQRAQSTYLHPAFTVALEPQSYTTLYLKISNSTTMLSGGVFLYDKATFTRLDRELQINIAFF